jgi:hypothetical protein
MFSLSLFVVASNFLLYASRSFLVGMFRRSTGLDHSRDSTAPDSFLDRSIVGLTPPDVLDPPAFGALPTKDAVIVHPTVLGLKCRTA